HRDINDKEEGIDFEFLWNAHWFNVTSQSRLRSSMILSGFGPSHALTVLFLETQTRTSQWVIHPRISLTRTHLTSEFQWNPKPMSSQKASCYRSWACTYKAHHPLPIGRCGMLHLRID
ncbi:hypothetical protein DVH24_021129, partial [Malus domestica]